MGSLPRESASRYIAALSGITRASPTLVMPLDRCRIALRCTRSATASSPYNSMWARIVMRCTGFIARSQRVPSGSPLSSRTITPRYGSGVSRSIPASFRAAELLYVAWYEKSMMQTGLSGAASSSSHRVIRRFSPQVKGSKPRPHIHCPLGAPAAAAAMASTTPLMPSRGGMRQSTDTGSKVVIEKWLWGSMKPGVRVRPTRETTSVESPAMAAISAAKPTPAILPSRTATASAPRPWGSIVRTVPPVRIVSISYSLMPCQPSSMVARSASTSSNQVSRSRNILRVRSGFSPARSWRSRGSLARSYSSAGGGAGTSRSG